MCEGAAAFVVLLGCEDDELECGVECWSGVHIELLGEIAGTHDDAGVARQTAADFVSVEDASRCFDETPDFLWLMGE